MELSRQRLGDIRLLVVQLKLLDGNYGVRLNLCGIHAEGQRRNRRACGQTGHMDIAQRDLASLILVGGVLCRKGDTGQRQDVSVVFHRHQAVGRCVLTLRNNLHGNGLFIFGNRDIGSCGFGLYGVTQRENLRRGLEGNSVQAAVGRSGVALASGLTQLVSGYLHRVSGHGSLSGQLAGIPRQVGIVHSDKQSRGPDVGAEVCNQSAIPAVVRQNHSVDLIGITGEVGQVQHQFVIFHRGDHGAVHAVIVSGKVQTVVGEVAVHNTEVGRVALSRLIDTEIPDVPGIIQRKEELSDRIIDAVLIRIDLSLSQRGKRGEVVGIAIDVQVESKVKAVAFLLIRRSRSEQNVVIDGGKLRIFRGGEDGAVFHIPHGEAQCSGGIGFERLAGVGINLVEVIGILCIHRIDNPIEVIQRGGGDAGSFQRHIRRPGLVICQIPDIELRFALGILQRAGDGHVHSLYGDSAGSALGRILDRGRGDDGLALFNGGHNAVRIDSGDLLVGGTPRHGIGLDTEGADLRGELAGGAAVEGHRLFIKSDFDRIVEFFLVEIDLIGAVVIRVVIHLQEEVIDISSVRHIQIQRDGLAASCAFRRTGRLGENGLLVIIDEEGRCNVAVVLCDKLQNLIAGLDAFLEVDIGQLRRGLIDKCGIGLCSAIAQSVPIGHGGFTAVINIVLRSHGNADLQLGILRRALGSGADRQVGFGVLPACGAFIVEG